MANEHPLDGDFAEGIAAQVAQNGERLAREEAMRERINDVQVALEGERFAEAMKQTAANDRDLSLLADNQERHLKALYEADLTITRLRAENAHLLESNAEALARAERAEVERDHYRAENVRLTEAVRGFLGVESAITQAGVDTRMWADICAAYQQAKAALRGAGGVK